MYGVMAFLANSGISSEIMKIISLMEGSYEADRVYSAGNGSGL